MWVFHESGVPLLCAEGRTSPDKNAWGILMQGRSISLGAVAFLGSISLALAAGSAASSQLLEVHDATLTDYKAAATNIQGVQPLVAQRGTNIEGSLRSPSTFKVALHANPFERIWRGTVVLTKTSTASQ